MYSRGKRSNTRSLRSGRTCSPRKVSSGTFSIECPPRCFLRSANRLERGSVGFRTCLFRKEEKKKKKGKRKKERKEKKSADYRPLSSNNRGLVAGQILFDIFLFLFFVLFFFIPHLVRVILSSSGPPGPRKVPRVPTSSNSRHQ